MDLKVVANKFEEFMDKLFQERRDIDTSFAALL